MSPAYALVVAAFALYLLGAAGGLLAFAAGERARQTLGRAALAAAALGAAANLAGLVVSGVALERFPAATERETLVLAALCVALVELVNCAALRLRTTLGPSLLLAAAYLFAGAVARGRLHDARAIPELLRSGWFVPHLAAYFVGYAYLAQAGLGALLYPLVRAKRGEEAAGALARELLARAVLGFPFLTLGLVTGALWAQDAWAAYWSRGPKETWALVTWLVYAAYLRLALRSERDARRTLALLAIGFGALLFTWQGVRVLPSGKTGALHVYTGGPARR